MDYDLFSRRGAALGLCSWPGRQGTTPKQRSCGRCMPGQKRAYRPMSVPESEVGVGINSDRERPFVGPERRIQTYRRRHLGRSQGRSTGARGCTGKAMATITSGPGAQLKHEGAHSARFPGPARPERTHEAGPPTLGSTMRRRSINVGLHYARVPRARIPFRLRQRQRGHCFRSAEAIPDEAGLRAKAE